MTDVSTTSDDVTEAALRRWIERELGASVEALWRQDRWRPAWFVKARRNGEDLPLYVRGERNVQQGWPLDMEMAIMQVLYEEDIPVPRIYGMCDEPKAIVMEWAAGSRNLSGYSLVEKQRIERDYVEILARIHAIPVERFTAIGLDLPKSSGEIAAAFIGPARRAFAAQKVAPDGFVAFLDRWIDDHMPPDLTEVALITGDPAQFLVQDGRITVLHDFETAHIGSPWADVACLRVRELPRELDEEEPLTDAVMMMKHYAATRGTPLDPVLLNYFHLLLAASTFHFIHPNFHEPRADYPVWRKWEVRAARQVLGCMADIQGIRLERLDPPEQHWRDNDVAFASLRTAIEALPIPSPHDSFNRDNALALARMLEATMRDGWQLAEAEKDDVATLTGTRPATLAESEALLEEAVHSGVPDEKLIRFFDRRSQRRRSLLADVYPNLWQFDIPPLSRKLSS